MSVIDFSEEKSGKAGVLKFEGEVTVQQAEEIKDKLMQALGRVENIYVDISKVSEADLSLLQLMCSAHRTAVTMHKGFHISGPVPEYLRQLAEMAGFRRDRSCRLDSTKTCIWVGMFRPTAA
jgi:ABC-type transporter Mla MlaB component